MTFPPPEIRVATVADASAVAALMTELGYATSADAMARRLPSILANPAQRLFVAIGESSHVIGCIHIGLYTILERDLSAQLMAMIVAASHRRRGVGRALVNAAEGWAKSEACEMVYVRTNVIRPDAPAFYEGLGYVNTKTQFAFRKQLPVAP